MNPDPILFWNAVALEVHRRDFTVNHDGDGLADGDLSPAHSGPTRTSRALAIVHLAMYGAFAATAGVVTQYPPLDAFTDRPGDSDSAVAGAAICTLTALYPHPTQRAYVASQGRAFFDQLAIAPGLMRAGIAVGDEVAVALLKLRKDDHSEASAWYVPASGKGQHRGDPYQPGQGFTGARWGQVDYFFLGEKKKHTDYLAEPPVLGSDEYKADYKEVRVKGAAPGAADPAAVVAYGIAPRTPEETLKGVFWGYDGARGLGTPPRLYNQCVRAIADKQNNTVAQNARLFALVNAGMADAAIVAWAAKYHYNLWRPVVGIREHEAAFGAGDTAGSGPVDGDPYWAPLGAPQSNQHGVFHHTPDFPAYPSGHATFGSVVFNLVRSFYAGEDLTFKFMSDESNGRTQDADGSVRTAHLREFTLSQAIHENAESRVFLGVHWRFDGLAPASSAGLPGPGIGGVAAGQAIAAEISGKFFNEAPAYAKAAARSAAPKPVKAKSEKTKGSKK